MANLSTYIVNSYLIVCSCIHLAELSTIRSALDSNSIPKNRFRRTSLSHLISRKNYRVIFELDLRETIYCVEKAIDAFSYAYSGDNVAPQFTRSRCAALQNNYVCAENFLASLDNYYCKVSNSYIILFSLIFAEGEIPGVCIREAILSKIDVLASKLHTGGDHSISCTPPTNAETESQNVSNHLSLILLPLRDILLCALDTLPGTDGIRHSLRFR